MPSSTFLLGAIGCAVIFLCAICAIFILVSSIVQTKKNGAARVYEDRDGVATPESIVEFSTKLPKILVGLLSLLGLGVSSSIAVLDTLGSKDGFFMEDWLNAASWVCGLNCSLTGLS
jgi:hypothetical protein